MPEKKGGNLPSEQETILDAFRSSEEPISIKRFKENIEAAGRSFQSINEAIIEYANSLQLDADSIARILKRSGTMNDKKTENNDNDYFIDQSLNNLELELIRHKQKIAESSVEEIDVDLLTEFENIFINLKEFSGSRPEKLVSIALSSVNSLERKHFLLSNLLESLKKGDNYYDTLNRFNNLGITNIKMPEPKKEKKYNIEGKGSGILASMKSLKNFALALYQVIINSIKSIPSFIKLKPRVGVSGMFPSISFEIEGSSVTIQKFYELLSKNA